MGDISLESKNIITRSNNDHVNDDETYAYATQIITSCALPMVLHAAFDTGVLRLISEAGTDGLSAAEITVRLDIQNPDAPVMLDRMLRLLATYSVVSCRTVPTTDNGVERRYGPAPVTRHFVADEDGISMGPSLSLVNDLVFLKSWSKLKDAMLEGGIPFNKVHGMHAFEYKSLDPRFNDIFNKAMYTQSTELVKKILETYKGFEHIQQLVDVGGGLGHNLDVITSKYPSIKGINFDLPHVVKNAPAIRGVEHVGGDMFESVPRGDAIFIKWVLHDWSDEHCLKILKNCYKALPENGKVIIVETTIKDEPEKTVYGRATSQMDVYMMIHVGGKERTLKEFEALAMAAGFSGFKVDSCVSYHNWAMELYK